MASKSAAVSRERVNVIEQIDLVKEVPKALAELEREAKAEEEADHDMIDPVAIASSADTQEKDDQMEPSKKQENVKTILEDALGHDIDVFKGIDRDPKRRTEKPQQGSRGSRRRRRRERGQISRVRDKASGRFSCIR